MTSMKCIQSVINCLASKEITNRFKKRVTSINIQNGAGLVRQCHISQSGPYGVGHLYLVQ